MKPPLWPALALAMETWRKTEVEGMKTAIYTRVSTVKGQTTENQTPQLEAFCQARGWEMVARYDESETASGARERKQFARMMEDARRGKFQVLVFWALDRFSREGVLETLTDLRRLDDAKVRYVSLTEQWLDSMGMFRDAIIGIMAAVAKIERQRLSERVKAGLERAKREGRRLGRKPAEVDEDSLRKAMAADWSYWQMSRAFGVSRTTLYRRILKLDKEKPHENVSQK